jgi:hypothetical protein
VVPLNSWQVLVQFAVALLPEVVASVIVTCSSTLSDHVATTLLGAQCGCLLDSRPQLCERAEANDWSDEGMAKLVGGLRRDVGNDCQR